MFQKIYRIHYLFALEVRTMKKFISVMAILATAAVASAGYIPDGATGLWRFENSANIGQATFGTDLVLNEFNGGPYHWMTGPWTVINPFFSDNGITQDVGRKCMTVYHNILANGGGSYINEYTIAMDINPVYQDIDYSVSHGWHSLYQTTWTPPGGDGSNDGDLWISPYGYIGVGDIGYSAEPVVPDGTWHRVVWSVDNGSFFRVYVDGILVLDAAGQEIDGRFSLELDRFHIFADNDWEDGPILIGTLATWGRALTSVEIAQMGGWLDGSDTPTPLVIPIHVDSSAPAGGDGWSWGTAYRYLQDALAFAYTHIRPEVIFVAEGTYKPDQSDYGNANAGDRTETFQLLNEVGIHGGFPAGGGTWGERDPDLYPTILSGDLLGNDAIVTDPCQMLTEPTRSDNSYHVITGSGNEPNAILDGFTITGGQADGVFPDNKGGGLNADTGSPTISDCTFTYNAADYGGAIHINGNTSMINCIITCNAASLCSGGFYSGGGMPKLENCTISENQSDLGGGIYVDFATSSIKLTDCRIIKNSAGWGGGIFLSNYIEPTFARCTFTGNIAQLNGGGIYAYSELTADNCIFSGNTAGGVGGGIYYSSLSTEPDLTNCTFSLNSATEGGGIYSKSDCSLANCIFWGNIASSNGPQITLEDCNVVISYSDVQDGQVYTKGNCSVSWTGSIFSDPLLINPYGADNTLGTEDDNLRLAPNSPCIDAGDNDAVDVGTTTDLAGHPRFTDNPEKDDMGKGSSPIVDMGAYEMQEIYVDATAIGDNNGASWEDAYNFLQDGLTDAQNGGAMVYIAQGIYKPDSNSSNPAGSGDRTASFRLIRGTGLYGGFPSGGCSWYDRMPTLFQTILSGDLRGNDSVVADPCDMHTDPSRSDNSYNVVTGGIKTNSTTILDGFTITGGQANGGSWPIGYGGGYCGSFVSPTIRDCNFIYNAAAVGGAICTQGDSDIINCTLTRNAASFSGGSMFIYSKPNLVNCTISENQANTGGGICASAGAGPALIKMKDCRIIKNRASTEAGGGMHIKIGARAFVSRCTFSGNLAQKDGGGIYALGDLTVDNSIFSGNSSGGGGGGISYGYSYEPNLISCTFSLNSATEGGGIYSRSDRNLVNCIFWGNTASNNGDQISLEDCNAIISFSDIQEGRDGIYTTGSCTVIWGTGNMISNPLFEDDDGSDDITGTEDDNVHLLSYSPCINAGDPCGSYSDFTDIDVQPRVIYGRADMGADEVFPIAGDFGLEPDEDVDLFDLADLAAYWLDDTCSEDNLWCYRTDVNKNGDVTFIDYAYFAHNWLLGIE